jgi:hypothetical protein
MYHAQIIADSISPDGVRLTTFEVEYPHAIHKDIMTHRMLSRNFQSFRAYPPEKVIEKIKADPFIPESFDSRVKGMGQGDPLDEEQRERALCSWMSHVDHCIWTARDMIRMDMAKAQVNFILQDLTWIRGVITATEWDNFFGLRLAINPDTGKPFARPEVYKIANMMKKAYESIDPWVVNHGEWHLPYVGPDFPWDGPEPDWDYWKKVSAARCARISYLTHDGKHDPEADLRLHDQLLGDHHMSPFEHQATPLRLFYKDEIPFVGNFQGWRQYRKEIPGEKCFTGE